VKRGKTKNKLSALVVLLLIALFSLQSCDTTGDDSKKDRLPIFGQKEFIPSVDKDTVYHTIPFWSFVNQDGDTISKLDYKNQIYVADFFFTHCPTICPVTLKKMKRLQEATKGDDILLLSHTVDPEYDTVGRLKWYCEVNEIDNSNWNFVTGEKETIYKLGLDGYLTPNQEDALAPGGFLHSDKFILIDKEGRIRGFYSGTEDDEVDLLIEDIKKLKDEYK